MNKQEQKQILIDIMNKDQKDGLYEVHQGLMRFRYDGKFYVYATCYNGIWSDGYELHPNEHRTWVQKMQMGEFKEGGGKNVKYKIVYGDGVPYASLDIRSDNTEGLGSKLDLILEEIKELKWMIRDMNSKL